MSNRVSIPVGPGPIVGRPATIERRRIPKLGHAWSRKVHRYYRRHGMLWETMLRGTITSFDGTALEVEGP